MKNIYVDIYNLFIAKNIGDLDSVVYFINKMLKNRPESFKFCNIQCKEN